MKILNLFGKSMVSIVALTAFCGADAAQNGRASMMSTNSARMPTMPTFSLNTIGNPAVTTAEHPVNVNNTYVPTPTPTPTPDPQPVVECPDGGVKNSTYTITMCMNDVLQCVNTGALQGGLNDLFNEDVRNSIMSGMKLCQASVDKCIHDVRVDCRNVYAQSNDVWLDFNSRIVQPEYYNFVLRKTGLTPNQAENTCLLLDRNAYGSSFSAVSDTNVVNTEYNNKVGAYNASVNGTLSKDNPQGVAVNTVGYDGNRGHYARWDAAKAECLIRVAAYNKDKLITNSWLFGAVGNDNPAEVWEKAGSTFTCSKELFDFSSLLNNTKTAAVIGVGGGAVLGTAIGAAAGAGVYNKKVADAEEAKNAILNEDLCDEQHRKELAYKIRTSANRDKLHIYLYKDVKASGEWGDSEVKVKGSEMFPNADFSNIDPEQCKAIYNLRDKVKVYEEYMNMCENNPSVVKTKITQTVPNVVTLQSFNAEINGNTICSIGTKECGTIDVEKEITEYKQYCLLKPLQMGFADPNNSHNPGCTHNGVCIDIKEARRQIADVNSLLKEIAPVMKATSLTNEKELNKGAEIGKGAGIGLATGAAAGGIATAITAFVERSNITCKVGDGLNSVALGKAHTIDSLKDFYVKWNLHLPDTVSPTSAVSTRADWEQACGQFNNKLADCPKVQINLKDKSGKYTLVPSACKVSGNICIVNDSVMTSYGIQ